MTGNPDPKDMLHIISRLSALLGHAQYALELNDQLLSKARDRGPSAVASHKYDSTHQATQIALAQINKWLSDEAPDAG